MGFYRWAEDASGVIIRLVTSFASRSHEIDRAVDAARASVPEMSRVD